MATCPPFIFNPLYETTMTNQDTVPTPSGSPSTPIVRIDKKLFGEVRVELEARLGTTELSVDALLGLKAGSVVTLQTGLADHVDLFVNGACVARGEIVAVGDQFGVRIVEVAAEK